MRVCRVNDPVHCLDGFAVATFVGEFFMESGNSAENSEQDELEAATCKKNYDLIGITETW